MRADTEKMLCRLKRIQWFTRCGEYEGLDYAKVRPKAEAIKSLTSRKWYNFSIPPDNYTRQQVIPAFPTAEAYNEICYEVCGTITDGLMVILRNLIHTQLDSAPTVEQCIRRDVAHILWETEFNYITPPFFHCPLILPVYEMGHLPCGWTGEVPPDNWPGTSLADLPPGKIRVF